MGIAESISAVGIAGTVTGLSYTQATAQQKEDEEEVKRTAEAEAALATASAPRGNNRNKQRAGAAGTGRPSGAFPVSGNLGGVREPDPKRGTKNGGAEAGNEGGRRQDGGRMNAADDLGRAGKRQIPTEPSSRADNASQKKKKNGNRRNQPQIPVDDNIPASTSNTQDTTSVQSQTPAKGRRRGGGKKRNASNVPSQITDGTDELAVDSATIKDGVTQQVTPVTPANKRAPRNHKKSNNASATTSPPLEVTTSSPAAVTLVQDPSSSQLPHPSTSPQSSRTGSRARSRRPRGNFRKNANTAANNRSSQAVETSPETQTPAAAAAATSGDVIPMLKPTQSAGHGRGRGGRRANVERSRPLVSSSQPNRIMPE
ncbi:hypothetical protein J3R30DRAFT_726934 [Lentinula aciculospora]|uniref:Uncharacterized protein n=1 Tax=Lentinula aciculospora TaxID=153920 RepID=A0A9W9A3Q0_9AGAR|nr:hypothetical protein J3R30DRAFT_726934 [Lentinula aciculospora]